MDEPMPEANGPSWWQGYRRRVREAQARLAGPATQPVGLSYRASMPYRVRRPGPRHWLDLSEMVHVLDVPVAAGWVDVEGGVSWRQLVAALAPHGRLPAVVPEDGDQCIGAALADVAVGAGSFRHGPVHAALLDMDVLLPDGQLVRCSAEERDDLFRGFPGSCGTLGYVLRARLRTEAAGPRVAVREERLGSTGDLVDALLRPAGDDVLGVEGVAYSRSGGMLRTARFPGGPLLPGERAMALEDWLWRWEAGVEGAAWPWRPAARLHFEPPDEDVVQDLVVPAARAAQLLDAVVGELGIQPVWLCGLSAATAVGCPLFPLRADERYVNLGVWGRVHDASAAPGQANRALEAWAARLGGMKAPYAQCFLPSQEFDQIYDLAAYARLKSKYDPLGRAPHLYDKCVRGG